MLLKRKLKRDRKLSSRDGLCLMQTLSWRTAFPVTTDRQTQDQERNSTDSRWNIFTAIKMAAPPYRQVERKISAIEFQW